jgi:parallel beta-helix repeat protein
VKCKDGRFNNISGNVISENGGSGLAFYWPNADDNTVTMNRISGNLEDGIFFESSSNGNHIYHNNFIDNTQQAFDESSNLWDNGYPSGGNYWSDYTGEDNDGDGIGDTAYTIPPDNNEDHFPFMNENGWVTLNVDTLEISAGTGGTINFTLTAGAIHANRDYVLLGSITGTEPGIQLPGGLILPLHRDSFTDITFNFANTPFFVNFKGTLDNSGSGNAQFNTLGPLPNVFVGRTVHFAFFLYGPFDFVSSPVAIEIVQ